LPTKFKVLENKWESSKWMFKTMCNIKLNHNHNSFKLLSSLPMTNPLLRDYSPESEQKILAGSWQ
jgi:hypothetical protein